MDGSAPGRIELLFVTSQTSGVGRRMESIVATLQARNRDRVDIRRVDADEDAELVERLGIREVPALVFVQPGGHVTLEGRSTLDQLEQVLAGCT